MNQGNVRISGAAGFKISYLTKVSLPNFFIKNADLYNRMPSIQYISYMYSEHMNTVIDLNRFLGCKNRMFNA